MGSLAGTPDSDCTFLDPQIYDPKTGFPMKKVMQLEILLFAVLFKKILG